MAWRVFSTGEISFLLLLYFKVLKFMLASALFCYVYSLRAITGKNLYYSNLGLPFAKFVVVLFEGNEISWHSILGVKDYFYGLWSSFGTIFPAMLTMMLTRYFSFFIWTFCMFAFFLSCKAHFRWVPHWLASVPTYTDSSSIIISTLNMIQYFGR